MKNMLFSTVKWDLLWGRGFLLHQHVQSLLFGSFEPNQTKSPIPEIHLHASKSLASYKPHLLDRHIAILSWELTPDRNEMFPVWFLTISFRMLPVLRAQHSPWPEPRNQTKAGCVTLFLSDRMLSRKQLMKPYSVQLEMSVTYPAKNPPQNCLKRFFFMYTVLRRTPSHLLKPSGQTKGPTNDTRLQRAQLMELPHLFGHCLTLGATDVNEARNQKRNFFEYRGYRGFTCCFT